MHFDLIQSIGLAGDATVPNDDRAGAGDRRAWVIDGATDLGPPGLLGPRGGAAWLAMEAEAAFAAAADAPIAALCRAVLDRLADRYHAARTRDPVDRWELPMASVLAARLDDGMLEAAWLGDCVAILRHTSGTVRLGIAPEGKSGESARAASLAAHGLGSVKTRTGPILDVLRASRARLGLAVLGVEPEAADRLGTVRVACAPGDDLLLMTDGFAALIDQYEAFDADGLMAALDAEGLAALGLRLRAIEADDAASTRFPRFKRSDDATALWLRIAG